MVNCPWCDEEIDHLERRTTGIFEEHIYKDGTTEEKGFYNNETINDYDCPNCGKTIFNKTMPALAFIKESGIIIEAEKGEDFQDYNYPDGNEIPAGEPIGIEINNKLHLFTGITYG